VAAEPRDLVIASLLYELLPHHLRVVERHVLVVLPRIEEKIDSFEPAFFALTVVPREGRKLLRHGRSVRRTGYVDEVRPLCDVQRL
jgi:hypothetical protein